MKLWYLGANENRTDGPYHGYDCYTFMIVRAATESVARQLASEQAADETPEFWLNPEWSTCEEYTFPTVEGESEVVWKEFHPG